jgi:hypothetical protein
LNILSIRDNSIDEQNVNER